MGVDRWNSKLRNFIPSTREILRPPSDAELSSFLAEQGKRLRGQSRYGGTTERKAEGKRKARDLQAKYLKRLWRRYGYKRRIIANIAALLFVPKPDCLRDTLTPKFRDDWIPMRRRLGHGTTKEISLRDFSFAKNPGQTLEQLAALIAACAKYPDLRVDFRDTVCDDVTPYIVLAHLRRALPPIISGGVITRDVREVIEAVGMRGELRIGTIGPKKGKPDYLVSAFRMVNRTPPGTFGDEDHLLRPQFKEFVADRFCDTLNGWLRGEGIELTEEAEGSFVRAIGEALDNAERHGDPTNLESEGDWSIAAFSRFQMEDGRPLLRCSVGIVSVGATISQSLVSAADEVRSRINDYVQRHTPLFRAKHSEECLRTVMALQDGITRVKQATEGRRGGVGFMELIEIFSELGENGRDDLQSTFTVISGRSCIRITAPYRRGDRKEDGLRQLWFNEENDDSQPPSQEHVMTLDSCFPGVILSACFTIDPDYLRKKLEQ